MEEDQNVQNVQEVEDNPQQETQERQVVSNVPGKKKKSKNGLIIALFVMGLVLVIGGIFLVIGKDKVEEEVEPTPDSFIIYDEEEEEPGAASEPVEKESISVQILNGTGIPGEASYLKEQLEDLGFVDIEAANASDQSYSATKVTFSSDLPDELIDEVMDEIEKIYEDSTSSTKSSQDYDIMIITGLRKGQTPKPEATDVPEATPTSSPNVTESPTPTPTSAS